MSLQRDTLSYGTRSESPPFKKQNLISNRPYTMKSSRSGETAMGAGEVETEAKKWRRGNAG